VITNNDVYGNQRGIRFENPWGSFQQNRIVGNDVHDHTGNGIEIVEADQQTINGNHVWNCGTGINTWNGAWDNVFERNRVEGCATGFSWGSWGSGSFARTRSPTARRGFR